MFNGDPNHEYDDEAAGREEAAKAIDRRVAAREHGFSLVTGRGFTEAEHALERSVVAAEEHLGRHLSVGERDRIAAIIAECPEFGSAEGPAVLDLVAELADAEAA